MLTPVRATSNASFSSQGHNSSINADGAARATTAVVPVNQVESADLTALATAKLNILLLAVRVRMVEALLDVLNATGSALSQPRDDDEPELAFAARLAGAIQKLPAGKIEAIERQLAAQGHSIPLRLLAEALKNPAGPEAARIAAYLETIRYKDRDLATRAVVRSYGQNDASPARQEQRPAISLHRDNVPTPSRTGPALPRDAKAEGAAGTRAVAAAYLGTKIDEAKVASPPTSPPIAKATDNEPRLSAKAGNPAAAEAARTMAADEATAPAETEAPTGSTSTAEITAEPKARPVAGKADPIIPKSWAGIAASVSEDTTEMIVAIIQDQQAELLVEAVDVEAAVEIDVMLDETLIADIPDNLIHKPDQTLANGLTRQAAPLAAQSPLEAATASLAAQRQATSETEQPSAAQQTIDAAYAPTLMRIVEGVPYAIQPYKFAKDDADDGGARDMNREDHNGEPDGDEPDQQDTEPQEEARLSATPVAETEQTVSGVETAAASQDHLSGPVLPMLPAPGLAMAASAEDAYARYRRLVGWE